jgi:hypothetical protein
LIDRPHAFDKELPVPVPLLSVSTQRFDMLKLVVFRANLYDLRFHAASYQAVSTCTTCFVSRDGWRVTLRHA